MTTHTTNGKAATTPRKAARPRDVKPRAVKPVGGQAKAPAPGRDQRGRFQPGNTGGVGNPYARQVAILRRELMQTTSPQDIRRIGLKLKALALEGNVPAAKRKTPSLRPLRRGQDVAPLRPIRVVRRRLGPVAGGRQSRRRPARAMRRLGATNTANAANVAAGERCAARAGQRLTVEKRLQWRSQNQSRNLERAKAPKQRRGDAHEGERPVEKRRHRRPQQVRVASQIDAPQGRHRAAVLTSTATIK